MTDLVLSTSALPAVVAELGPKARRRFVEFFTAQIPNDHTRRAYARAVSRFSLWCEEHGFMLDGLEPVAAAAYIQHLLKEEGLSISSVKVQLSALRRLCDWMVTGGALSWNPFAAVKGPRQSQRVGKTPVLDGEAVRELLDSIETDGVVGLRDRALLSAMLFAFARVGAVVKLRVRDYETRGRSATLALREKGGVFNRVPCHHRLAAALDAYLAVAGGSANGPLFRSVAKACDEDGARVLTRKAISPRGVLHMVKTRCAAVGVSAVAVCNHSFRATGITSYMENGGSLDVAAEIAGHASTKTTQLYNRAREKVQQDEIERVRF